MSSVPSGGFLCSFIYCRNAPGVSNVNIWGALGATMSGGNTTKPLMFITISSNVSENIWPMVSIAVCMADVGTPTAPIHNVSFVPIANSDVCRLPIFGVGFNV